MHYLMPVHDVPMPGLQSDCLKCEIYAILVLQTLTFAKLVI